VCRSFGDAALAALACALAAAGCVQGEDSAFVQARIALEAPFEDAAQGSSARDEHGLLHLSAHPVYVAFEVSAPDIESIVVRYPEDPGTVDASARTVTFDGIEVAPGKDRTITAIALHKGEVGVSAYLPEEPKVLDLSAGQAVTVSLALSAMPTGTVSGACSASQHSEIWLVEIDNMVVLATQSAGKGFYAFDTAPFGVPLAIAALEVDGTLILDVEQRIVLSPSVTSVELDL